MAFEVSGNSNTKALGVMIVLSSFDLFMLNYQLVEKATTH